MLFLSDDLVLETFDSPDHPPADLEWIDVENEEYEFCDEDGQRYRGELVHRGGFFKSEKWRLVPDGKPNLENALSLVDRAVMVDSSRCSFPDIESLRQHLTCRCS